jgi:hypothetical protein
VREDKERGIRLCAQTHMRMCVFVLRERGEREREREREREGACVVERKRESLYACMSL